MQETRYSYHLNFFRVAVMITAIITFKELFRSQIYLRPIALSILFMTTLGLLFSLFTDWVDIAYQLHSQLFFWMLLQAQTVITEGLLFFIIIPYLLRNYAGIGNPLLSVAIFAIAHGLTPFLPVIFIVGLFYMRVLKDYGFNTHLLVHFSFNLTQVLLFRLTP
jgi:hypothetical protein